MILAVGEKGEIKAPQMKEFGGKKVAAQRRGGGEGG